MGGEVLRKPPRPGDSRQSGLQWLQDAGCGCVWVEKTFSDSSPRGPAPVSAETAIIVVTAATIAALLPESAWACWAPAYGAGESPLPPFDREEDTEALGG